MIVYEATKWEFVDYVFSGSITDEIYDVFKGFVNNLDF